MILLIAGCIFSVIFYHTTNEFSVFNTEIAESIHVWINVDPRILQMVFLPLLIFASSFSTSAYILGKQIEQILWLAIPGVAMGTALTGLFIHNVLPYDWGWNTSLLLGAILSATDPVSVVSILKDLGAPEKVATLIEGESLFNDGTAIVAFELCLESVLGVDRSVGQYIAEGARLALGGPAIGILSGIIGCYALSFIFNDPISEITLTLLLSYGTYTLSEIDAKVSGVLAVVFLGLWLSFYGRGKISPSVGPSLDNFWVVLEFIANTIIFFVTGLIVTGQGFLLSTNKIRPSDWGYMVSLYFWLTLVRLTILFISWPVFQYGQYGVSWQQMLVMSHAGLRGAVSLILALIVQGHEEIDSDIRERIMFNTSGVVALSLIVNGSTTKLLVHRLGLNHTTDAHKDVFRSAVNAIEAKLESDEEEIMKDPFLANASWATVWRYIPVLTAEGLWRRISLGHVKLSGEEVKDIRRHYELHNSQQQRVGRSASAPSLVGRSASSQSHVGLSASLQSRVGRSASFQSFEPNSQNFDFSFVLRDVKDANALSNSQPSSFSTTSRFISANSSRVWRHSARWRYSHLPHPLRILWFDILKTFQYDPEMIGEGNCIHIDDFFNKYSLAGEKEPPREWDFEEEIKQPNGDVLVATENAEVDVHSSPLNLLKDPVRSVLLLDSQSSSLHGRRRYRTPDLSLHSISSHTEYRSRKSLDIEEIKEARMRFLAALKAAYLSQFQRGQLVGDVYTMLQSSVLEVEDKVDQGCTISTSSLLERVKNASFVPETESTILRWFNWWPARVPIIGIVSNRVFHFLSIAWNMRTAYESVNLKDLYGNCTFALGIVKSEVDIQVALCKEAVENICKSAPFMSRAFKTKFAARLLLFRYQQHLNNLHMSGHILEKEVEVVSELITRSVIAISNHPLTEGLPKLLDVCRSIECLHTLSAHEISKLIENEALIEQKIVGSQVLMRIGCIECANGRKGWYYLIRGSVVRTVPFHLAQRGGSRAVMNGSSEVENKDVVANREVIDGGSGSVDDSGSFRNISRRNVFSRLKAASKPVTPTVSSEHHLGLLFGISDALLMRPQHAGYHTKEAFTHLVFFDLHKILALADNIPRLKEGIWRTVGAHALRHFPQYCTFTLRSLHKLLHDSLFHEVKAGCSVEFFLPGGSSAVVLRGSVNIYDDSLLKITKFERDEKEKEKIAPHPVLRRHSQSARKAKLLGTIDLPAQHGGSKTEHPKLIQTIDAPLLAECRFKDEKGEMLQILSTAESFVHSSGALFFIVNPKEIRVAHHESKIIHSVESFESNL